MKTITKSELENAIKNSQDIIIKEGVLRVVISANFINPRYARKDGEFCISICEGDVEIDGREVEFDSDAYFFEEAELTDAMVKDVNAWVNHFRDLAKEVEENK